MVAGEACLAVAAPVSALMPLLILLLIPLPMLSLIRNCF